MSSYTVSSQMLLWEGRAIGECFYSVYTSSPNVSAVEHEKKVISIWFYWSSKEITAFVLGLVTANNTDQSHNLENQAQAQHSKACSRSCDRHVIATLLGAFFELWNQWREDPEELSWENEYPVTTVKERKEPSINDEVTKGSVVWWEESLTTAQYD